MAKLGFTFDSKAVAIRAMISEGRNADALTEICAQLRAGASLQVQQIAAELLKPPTKKRGRPKTYPAFWLDIGREFDSLQADGETWETILVRLSEKYGYSESHIRGAKQLYDKARQMHDDASREFTAE